MGKECTKYGPVPLNSRDVLSADWDREDITAEQLVKEKGYTPQQATDWLRKIRVSELFEKNERLNTR